MFELVESQTVFTLRFKETQDQFFHYMLVVVFLIGAGLFLYFVGWPRYASASPLAGLTSIGLAGLMFFYALIANPIRFITSHIDKKARVARIQRKRRFGERELLVDFDDISKITCVTKRSKSVQISFLTLVRSDGRKFQLARVFGDPAGLQAAADVIMRKIKGKQDV